MVADTTFDAYVEDQYKKIAEAQRKIGKRGGTFGKSKRNCFIHDKKKKIELEEREDAILLEHDTRVSLGAGPSLGSRSKKTNSIPVASTRRLRNQSSPGVLQNNSKILNSVINMSASNAPKISELNKSNRPITHLNLAKVLKIDEDQDLSLSLSTISKSARAKGDTTTESQNENQNPNTVQNQQSCSRSNRKIPSNFKERHQQEMKEISIRTKSANSTRRNKSLGSGNSWKSLGVSQQIVDYHKAAVALNDSQLPGTPTVSSPSYTRVQQTTKRRLERTPELAKLASPGQPLSREKLNHSPVQSLSMGISRNDTRTNSLINSRINSTQNSPELVRSRRGSDDVIVGQTSLVVQPSIVKDQPPRTPQEPTVPHPSLVPSLSLKGVQEAENARASEESATVAGATPTMSESDDLQKLTRTNVAIKTTAAITAVRRRRPRSLQNKARAPAQTQSLRMNLIPEGTNSGSQFRPSVSLSEKSRSTHSASETRGIPSHSENRMRKKYLEADLLLNEKKQELLEQREELFRQQKEEILSNKRNVESNRPSSRRQRHSSWHNTSYKSNVSQALSQRSSAISQRSSGIFQRNSLGRSRDELNRSHLSEFDSQIGSQIGFNLLTPASMGTPTAMLVPSSLTTPMDPPSSSSKPMNFPNGNQLNRPKIGVSYSPAVEYSLSWDAQVRRISNSAGHLQAEIPSINIVPPPKEDEANGDAALSNAVFNNAQLNAEKGRERERDSLMEGATANPSLQINNSLCDGYGDYDEDDRYEEDYEAFLQKQSQPIVIANPNILNLNVSEFPTFMAHRPSPGSSEDVFESSDRNTSAMKSVHFSPDLVEKRTVDNPSETDISHGEESPHGEEPQHEEESPHGNESPRATDVTLTQSSPGENGASIAQIWIENSFHAERIHHAVRKLQESDSAGGVQAEESSVHRTIQRETPIAQSETPTSERTLSCLSVFGTTGRPGFTTDGKDLFSTDGHPEAVLEGEADEAVPTGQNGSENETLYTNQQEPPIQQTDSHQSAKSDDISIGFPAVSDGKTPTEETPNSYAIIHGGRFINRDRSQVVNRNRSESMNRDIPQSDASIISNPYETGLRFSRDLQAERAAASRNASLEEARKSYKLYSTLRQSVPVEPPTRPSNNESNSGSHSGSHGRTQSDILTVENTNTVGNQSQNGDTMENQSQNAGTVENQSQIVDTTEHIDASESASTGNGEVKMNDARMGDVKTADVTIDKSPKPRPSPERRINVTRDILGRLSNDAKIRLSQASSLMTKEIHPRLSMTSSTSALGSGGRAPPPGFQNATTSSFQFYHGREVQGNSTIIDSLSAATDSHMTLTLGENITEEKQQEPQQNERKELAEGPSFRTQSTVVSTAKAMSQTQFSTFTHIHHSLKTKIEQTCTHENVSFDNLTSPTKRGLLQDMSAIQVLYNNLHAENKKAYEVFTKARDVALASTSNAKNNGTSSSVIGGISEKRESDSKNSSNKKPHLQLDLKPQTRMRHHKHKTTRLLSPPRDQNRFLRGYASPENSTRNQSPRPSVLIPCSNQSPEPSVFTVSPGISSPEAPHKERHGSDKKSDGTTSSTTLKEENSQGSSQQNGETVIGEAFDGLDIACDLHCRDMEDCVENDECEVFECYDDSRKDHYLTPIEEIAEEMASVDEDVLDHHFEGCHEAAAHSYEEAFPEASEANSCKEDGQANSYEGEVKAQSSSIIEIIEGHEAEALARYQAGSPVQLPEERLPYRQEAPVTTGPVYNSLNNSGTIISAAQTSVHSMNRVFNSSAPYLTSEILDIGGKKQKQRDYDREIEELKRKVELNERGNATDLRTQPQDFLGVQAELNDRPLHRRLSGLNQRIHEVTGTNQACNQEPDPRLRNNDEFCEALLRQAQENQQHNQRELMSSNSSIAAEQIFLDRIQHPLRRRQNPRNNHFEDRMPIAQVALSNTQRPNTMSVAQQGVAPTSQPAEIFGNLHGNLHGNFSHDHSNLGNGIPIGQAANGIVCEHMYPQRRSESDDPQSKKLLVDPLYACRIPPASPPRPQILAQQQGMQLPHQQQLPDQQQQHRSQSLQDQQEERQLNDVYPPRQPIMSGSPYDNSCAQSTTINANVPTIGVINLHPNHNHQIANQGRQAQQSLVQRANSARRRSTSRRGNHSAFQNSARHRNASQRSVSQRRPNSADPQWLGKITGNTYVVDAKNKMHVNLKCPRQPSAKDMMNGAYRTSASRDHSLRARDIPHSNVGGGTLFPVTSWTRCHISVGRGRPLGGPSVSLIRGGPSSDPIQRYQDRPARGFGGLVQDTRTPEVTGPRAYSPQDRMLYRQTQRNPPLCSIQPTATCLYHVQPQGNAMQAAIAPDTRFDLHETLNRARIESTTDMAQILQGTMGMSPIL